MQNPAGIQNEPPEVAPENAPQCIPEGLYELTNKKIRKFLTLSSGNIQSGAACVGWPRFTDSNMDWQLWVLKRSGDNGASTLMSLRAGTFVDLRGGNQQDKAGVFAFNYVENGPGRLNQEWRISEEAPGYYTLQCSRTGTFLEMSDGSVSCSSATQERDHQLWSFERVSRTTLEIKGMISSWKPDLPDRLFQPYPDSTEYFVLPHELRNTIWNETRLLNQAICQHTFDYDDFVIKAKDAMNSWARDKLRTYGYSVLFGVVFGTERRGPRAYNWYLSRDMGTLIFFDAQTGTEYTAAALDVFGFEPTFAMF